MSRRSKLPKKTARKPKGNGEEFYVPKSGEEPLTPGEIDQLIDELVELKGLPNSKNGPESHES